MAEMRQLFGFHSVTARLRVRPESITTLYVADVRHDRRARELIDRAAVSDRIEMGLTEEAFGARLRDGLPNPN